jgi:hypothetical protein
MSQWFSALCTASAEPMVAACPTSVDSRHWCTDLPGHADAHRCLCGAWFTDTGLMARNQDRESAESFERVLDSDDDQES